MQRLLLLALYNFADANYLLKISPINICHHKNYIIENNSYQCPKKNY